MNKNAMLNKLHKKVDINIYNVNKHINKKHVMFVKS